MERTGFRVLYIVPILYLVSLYACPILLGFLPQGQSEEAGSAALTVMAIPFILAVANIAAAVVGYQSESRAFLLNSAVLLKYGLVLFFVMGGALAAGFALSTFIPVPFMIFVGPPTAIFLSVVGWVLMAAGSAYSLAYLVATHRDGMRSTTSTVVNALLQFVWVADVIDTMVLTWREGRWRGLTIVVAIVISTVAISLMIGSGWVFSTIASSVAAAAA